MADLIYPLGVICGMLGLFVLAQIVIAYIWLRWLSAKATTCPECGRKRAGAKAPALQTSTIPLLEQALLGLGDLLLR